MARALNTLRGRFGRRIAYIRTRNALNALPMRTRMDCDIAGRESEVARMAVYGR